MLLKSEIALQKQDHQRGNVLIYDINVKDFVVYYLQWKSGVFLGASGTVFHKRSSFVSHIFSTGLSAFINCYLSVSPEKLLALLD